MDLEKTATIIVDCAYRLGTKVGPGLTEHFYETVLARDLTRHGLSVQRQVPVSFDYEGLWFDDVFRIDILVERAIILEIKSVQALTPGFYKQVLTYLRATELKLGFLLNFGAPLMKQGIKRIIN